MKKSKVLILYGSLSVSILRKPRRKKKMGPYPQGHDSAIFLSGPIERTHKIKNGEGAKGDLALSVLDFSYCHWASWASEFRIWGWGGEEGLG